MPTPKVHYCLLSEDLRAEEGGKATLLGFLGVAPMILLGVGDFNVPVGRLIMLLGVGATTEEHKLELLLLDPNGNVLSTNPITLAISPHFAMMVLLNFNTLVLPMAGRYTVTVTHDGGTIFETTFDAALAKDLEQAKAKG